MTLQMDFSTYPFYMMKMGQEAHVSLPLLCCGFLPVLSVSFHKTKRELPLNSFMPGNHVNPTFLLLLQLEAQRQPKMG